MHIKATSYTVQCTVIISVSHLNSFQSSYSFKEAFVVTKTNLVVHMHTHPHAHTHLHIFVPIWSPFSRIWALSVVVCWSEHSHSLHLCLVKVHFITSDLLRPLMEDM